MTATLTKPTCPSWCDGTLCTPAHLGAVEHTSLTMTFAPTAQIDARVEVGLVQVDFLDDPYPSTSGPMVHVTISHPLSETPHGEPIEGAADLSPADARLLAAALIAGAERVERLHAEVTV